MQRKKSCKKGLNCWKRKYSWDKMKKKNDTNGWAHIILEAYCARKWSEKKDKYVYEGIPGKEFKTKKVPNTMYNPNYKTPKKPNYCPNTPRYICLEKECPHLAYTDAVEDDYFFLNKKYHAKKNKKKKRNNASTSRELVIKTD